MMKNAGTYYHHLGCAAQRKPRTTDEESRRAHFPRNAAGEGAVIIILPKKGRRVQGWRREDGAAVHQVQRMDDAVPLESPERLVGGAPFGVDEEALHVVPAHTLAHVFVHDIF